MISGCPKQDGYRMPAEWEKHDMCWLLWPFRTDNWRNGASFGQQAYEAVALAISRHERVTIGANQPDWLKCRQMLSQGVRVVEMSSDDAWVRDTGPTFVVKDTAEGKLVRAVKWKFNAWGNLYDDYVLDNEVGVKITEIERVEYYQCPIVMEGGSFHVDGEGTCVVTEECLLNPNRNPTYTKAEIEAILIDFLNVSVVIWLPFGLYEDVDTNGHVDNIFSFVRPGVAVLAWTDDENDAQYERSVRDLEVLSQATDAMGRVIQIHKLRIPSPCLSVRAEEIEGLFVDDDPSERFERKSGKRLPASYANFYIANGAVIMPVFGSPASDEAAIGLMTALFPDRTIEPVYSREILLGGGNIHCITQQKPI